MKTLNSAHTNFRRMPFGSYELTIEHSTVRGVSPEMLEWWFKNIGGNMRWQGEVYPRYIVWHPKDHIQWELAQPAPSGGAGVGAYFRIVEAFGADPRMKVDSTELVTKLDHTGIHLIRRIAGLEIFSLEHWFEAVPEGTRYTSRMQVGHESLLGKYLVNPLLHQFIFTAAMGQAWLKHNVEEVGNFERFLPELHQKETQKQVLQGV